MKRLRWDCKVHNGAILPGIKKFIIDDVPDDYHAMPYDIVFDSVLYKTSDVYREQVTEQIKKFENDLNRWYYTVGYKMNINERKALYGLLDAPVNKTTQAIKRFRKDGYFDRHLRRCEQLRREYYAMRQYFATI